MCKIVHVTTLRSVPVSSRPRRSQFLRETRRESRSLVVPKKRRETQYRAKTGPSLQVARQMAPCSLRGLARERPLPASRALRNAARPGAIWRSNAAHSAMGTDPGSASLRSACIRPQRSPSDCRTAPRRSRRGRCGRVGCAPCRGCRWAKAAVFPLPQRQPSAA